MLYNRSTGVKQMDIGQADSTVFYCALENATQPEMRSAAFKQNNKKKRAAS